MSRCSAIYKSRRGSILIEALIAALLLGVVVVALFAVFGNASDYSNVSEEYMMAIGLAREQLESLATHNNTWWSTALPYGSGSTGYRTVAVQLETSPVTLKGSTVAFTITNQAKRADASDQANIVMLTTITWNSHGKTGMSKARSYKLLNIIRDPPS